MSDRVEAEETPIGASSDEPTPAGVVADLVRVLGEQTDPAGKPWFRQPATFIAALAFLVSVASTVITVLNNRAQAHTVDRQQLLTLVESLAQVPQARVQIATTYRHDEQAQINLSSSETRAESIQADEAADLIDSLNGSVSASEAYQVGLSYVDVGLPEQALHYYTVAIRDARDAQTLGDVYRADAGALYSLGRTADAITEISRAYSVASVKAGIPAAEVAQSRVFTDLYDVPFAAGAHLCQRANTELTDAKTLTNSSVNRTSSSYSQDTARETSDTAVVRGCR